jgi:polar amino acid transport system substrate-binding protein
MIKKVYGKILGFLLIATIIASLTACKSASKSAASNATIVKGVTGGSLAPYFYQDENGKLIGTDIEIVEEAFRRLPQYQLEIEIADALQGVLSGQYDIAVNNYGYTEKRAESYYFSYPYKTSFNEYIQRADDTPLTSLSDVAARGYKIELTAGSLTASALEDWNKQHPDEQINIIYSESTFQVRYQNIVDGTTDFAIDDGPIIENLLPKFGLEGKLVANEIDPETEDFLFPRNNTYFLLTKDERGKEIRDALNKVIKEMTEDGTIAEITKKYLGVDTSVDPKYFNEPIN